VQDADRLQPRDDLGGEDALGEDEVVRGGRELAVADGAARGDVVVGGVGAAGVDEVEERCEGSIGVPAVGVVPVDDAELLAAGQGRVVEVAVEVVEPEDRPPVGAVEPGRQA